MKYQNTFSKGIVNKDLDSRFVDSNELIDAENFLVTTTESSSAGLGKNVLGNIKRTNLNIPGGKTIGAGKNDNKNKAYNIVRGTLHDYIIEYDTESYTTSIVAQSATGTILNFNDGERILNIDVIQGNEEDEFLLSISGDSNPPRIFNIERSKTWGIDGFTAEEIMLIKAPPLYPPEVEMLNTIDDKENFIKEKFISFSTRYKYRDDNYSAISSWQEYSFVPDKFQLDFGSCENKGMVNIHNACDITFYTGPREVIAIDLLFKYSNSDIVYKVDQFIKSEEGWSDNIDIPTPIQFTNSKVFSILPQDQYYRSYDNVPESSVAATVAQNRLIFANYKEGKNLIDKNDDPVVMEYEVGFSSVSPESDTIPITRLAATSIFDASSIADGKIRLDFTGVSFDEGSAIGIDFIIQSIPVSPPLSPTRPIFTFSNAYVVILNETYANISDLVADTSNEFESGIEGYLSDLFFASLVYPTDSLDFPPSLYNGFTVAIISTNVIEIVLPSMKYEIEVLPSGPNTFVKEYMQDSATSAIVDAIGSKKSMKSYRSYELVTLYKDPQGRKTTGLSSENNTVFIPLSCSANKNVLTVDMGSQMPPAWATTYKFAIKENTGTYEEIYVTDFYEDGYFRWVRLQGTNANKVKEGDVLLVKRDSTSVLTRPITVKVLEVKSQDENFLPGPIVETAGLYMKIKPEGFDMPYNPDSYKEFIGSDGERSGYPEVTLTIPVSTVTNNIPEGSILTVELHSNFSNEDEFNDYVSQPIVASSTYPDFKTFFNVQINSIVFQGNNTGVDFGGVFSKWSDTADTFRIRGTSDGRNTVISPKSGFLNVKVTLRTTAGFMIFETIGTEIDNGIFYETPDVFPIVDGEHVVNGENVVAGVHSLVKTFNCFSNGNGAESYQIRDAFNEKFLSIDFSPTAVSPDGYKQVNRRSDITYSGIYNSNTNVNKLNEFNLYTANFKEDIAKEYGPIYKIKGQDTNIQVYQEDKVSQVFYGKDILYNADGTSNLSQISNVLGIQDEYIGDYGISTHPDSYDDYGIDAYNSDVKRGVVIKKSNNGLFEISSQQMRSYFKKLFRDNTINQINGKYDQYNDFYLLNIQYNDTEYVTWAYSDKDNGWLGRLSFNPEDMIRVNGKFLSFKNGEIYEHNYPEICNTFYGIESPSTFKFNFSQTPSERKNFKTAEMEATDAWDLAFETDLDKGFVNKEDFVKQEGVFDAYIRTSNETTDTSLLSCQGIGSCAITGLVLSFSFELDSVVSIGDKIINISKQIVGTVLSKTSNSLTLNTVNNLSSGDYVMCAKIQSVENSSLLGYHMTVTATLSKNTNTEVYAVNSEVVKSYA